MKCDIQVVNTRYIPSVLESSVNLSLDSATIDRIVAGILQQISGEGGVRAERPVSSGVKSGTRNEEPSSNKSGASSPEESDVEVNEKVVTALTLDAITRGSRVVVGTKAIVTPAAWDVAKERGIKIQRQAATTPAKSAERDGSVAAKSHDRTVEASQLLIVVQNPEAVERLCEGLDKTWKRELVGCPDDAAKLAIGELARGSVKTAVILAEQTFRAACLANRHESVKAAAVQDVLEIKLARKQLRVNTWCVNPTSRTWYELRNMMLAIQGPDK